MSTSPMNKETEITDNGLPKVLSQIITDNVYFLKQRHRVPQTVSLMPCTSLNPL